MSLNGVDTDWEEISDFWGPVSNFGIPIAAVMDTQKDPEMCGLPSINTLSAFPPGISARPAIPTPTLLTHDTIN